MVLTKNKTGEVAKALLESIRETLVLELIEEATYADALEKLIG